ncbi:MAG TPA: T9SS type A sorting domain-containing protein [Bacteroidales bacterium]|nr:T9SS type A sorting domain-containing protein [Bacteroidales bacterium]
MKKLVLLFSAVICSIAINAQMKVFNNGKLLFGGTTGTVNGNMQFNLTAGATNGLTFYNSTFFQNALRLTVDDYTAFLRDGNKPNYGLGFFDGCVYIGNYSNFGDYGALSVIQDGAFHSYGLYAAFNNTSYDGVAVYANVARNTSLAFAANNNKFTVTGNGTVYAYGGYTPSDETLKFDIKVIEKPLDKILNLRGVSFRYKSSIESDKTQPTQNAVDSSTPTSKKNSYSPLDPEVMATMEKEDIELAHIGFIAQEVDKILPDVVRTSPSGTKAVAYSEIVALLVEGIKEQQTIIEEMKIQLENLEKTVAAQNASKAQTIANDEKSASSNDLLGAKLFQNTPNPFTQDTEIAFALPETIQRAEPYIYDMNGAQISRITLKQRGSASTTIHGGELTAGMYLYSLIADGKIIDTKRMILTK